MDYSQLSDFEINKRVAQLHGGFALTLAVIDAPPSGKSFHPGRFDPCNNPADAWPIIESNFIALHPLKHKSVWIAMSDDQEHTVRDEKPLRAAMIIFLMSKELFNA